MPPVYTAAHYVSDLRAIRATGSATDETSFYPALDRLLNAAGAALDPPILFSTQLRNQGAGMPDGGFFPRPRRRGAEPPSLGNPERGVVEIKPADHDLDALAGGEQVLRYLRHYGLVLITNLREFRLLQLTPAGAAQTAQTAHTLERYTIALTPAQLWSAPLASFARHESLLHDFLARVMLYRAPLTQPKDVAWLLASYAREARARAEDHPLASFGAVKLALQESLGIHFDGEKGEHFFRSTLVQTLFYGIFSAWVLWRRSDEGRHPGAHFDWRISAHFLRVPVLRRLFGQVADPGALNSLQLQEVLNLAGEALNRVQPAFFQIFRAQEAVAYFYEPFLEAFDPVLRRELGVWYTPKEIVHYMVERVDHLLRTELHQPDGLASPGVRILDPCCGTGAYLTAVIERIHRTLLEKAGDDAALVPHQLRRAALTRVFGFEILPAPFVIAHLQLASLLEDKGAPLTEEDRAQVFLTNALTGWVPEQHPQSVIFEEFRRERESAEDIKQAPSILVILGNPPYNGYAGIANIEEERGLTLAYAQTVPGLPSPQGQGLNDLYIRFFRIAERRIAQNDDHQGIVCFISNNGWLDGLSHPSMRHHYLAAFQTLYVDNLNGDRFRTGKKTPDGEPDPSVFSTERNPEGIQPGTAIATLVRTTARQNGSLNVRDLWGAGKRAQLESESRREIEPVYAPLQPAPALGLPFAHRVHSSIYTTWPRLPELFPVSFPGIKTSRDSLLVDIDRGRLEARMRQYLDRTVSDAEIAALVPGAMETGARFNPQTTRKSLQERGMRPWQVLRYAYRPFDLRWLYWEPETKLLDEKRETYVASVVTTTPAIISSQANRRSYDAPYLTRQLASLHVNERGCNAFPAHFLYASLPGEVVLAPNLSNNASTALSSTQHGTDDLFFHALAIMHTPAYRTENAGALLGDWPRIPLPASAPLLAHSASLGRRLAGLLDPESELQLTAAWSFLGRLDLPNPANLAEHLKLIAGWGYQGQGSTVMPGRGFAPARPWAVTEQARLATLAAAHALQPEITLALLGGTCLDIHLGTHQEGSAYWAAVPANVWSYTLGGYQVLKKWLSYREYPLLARALHPEEAAWFAQVVRRISAILLLGPALDASYAALLPTAQGLPSLQ